MWHGWRECSSSATAYLVIFTHPDSLWVSENDKINPCSNVHRMRWQDWAVSAVN
jgi:hypothetical protein